MRAGDVLILMRKRGRFFELLLGALQAEGIMVAGADRMKLAEQIEIQDLLALGDVMHLPDDDLQLAAVLKSPLFGMTEDELFTLAYDRGGGQFVCTVDDASRRRQPVWCDGRQAGALAKAG